MDAWATHKGKVQDSSLSVIWYVLPPLLHSPWCPVLANPKVLGSFACLMFRFVYTAYHHLKLFVCFLVRCMSLHIRMQASGGLGPCPSCSLLSSLSLDSIYWPPWTTHPLAWLEAGDTDPQEHRWISLCNKVAGHKICTSHSTERFLVILSENQSSVQLILKMKSMEKYLVFKNLPNMYTLYTSIA